MADFNTAVAKVLDLEGGWSNRLNDPGKATKFGVSLRFLEDANIDINGDGVIDERDVASLTRDKAISIYREHFWKFGSIANQEVADKLFDIYVNMTPQSAAFVFQKALVDIGKYVAVDGIMGPRTLAALNEVSPAKLLKELRVEAILHYHARTVALPSQETNFKGWVRRALA